MNERSRELLDIMICKQQSTLLVHRKLNEKALNPRVLQMVVNYIGYLRIIIQWSRIAVRENKRQT